jgi:hypothetical protein
MSDAFALPDPPLADERFVLREPAGDDVPEDL